MIEKLYINSMRSDNAGFAHIGYLDTETSNIQIGDLSMGRITEIPSVEKFTGNGFASPLNDPNLPRLKFRGESGNEDDPEGYWSVYYGADPNTYPDRDSVLSDLKRKDSR